MYYMITWEILFLHIKICIKYVVTAWGPQKSSNSLPFEGEYFLILIPEMKEVISVLGGKL